MAGAPSAEEHTLPEPSLGLTPAVIYGGAALWSLAMVSSLLVYEWRLNRFNSFHLPLLTVIFASGGATGWLTAVPIARWLTLGRGRETRLAAYILGLTLGTIGFTAFLFAIHYRIFYSRWHDPMGSIGWTFEFAETGIVSVYQFLVLGLPHFLPVAFPALFVASSWLAKSMR
jgi:hypothetical protein